MGKIKTKDGKVIAISLLLVSTLYTECLGQQLNNNAQFINTNSFQNGNPVPFANNANTIIGNQIGLNGQQTLNTYAPLSSEIYDVGTISKGYSDRQTPGVLGSYSNQPVHGNYWSATGQTKQYPTPYAAGYQQYPSQQQYYPQQYGYQHTGYNAYDDRYPSFDAQYWTRGPAMQQYPLFPSGPVYSQGYPGYPPRHRMPYQQYYPHHPAAYHPGNYRQQNKGFLGGTGRGLAKGLLGAALVGVIAGKVARG